MRSYELHLDRLEPRCLLSAGGRFAPIIVAPVRLVVVEDTATPVRVRVYDCDSSSLSVRIEVSAGYLTAKATPGVTVLPEGNRIVVVTGPRSAVNKSLEKVVFAPYADDTRGVTMAVTASDGRHRSVRTSSIRVVPVNDPPLIAAYGRVFATGRSIDLGSQPIFDVDSTRLNVTLTSDNGTVRILDPTARNQGSTARISGIWERLNAVLGTPGSIVLEPVADRNTRLTILVGDGARRTTKIVTVCHGESLQRIATDAIDSRIAGRDPAVAKPVFSVKDHTSATYVRNPDAWTRDLDLTSISPWNDAGGYQLAGTLVSPRHIVYATHFQIPVGATVRFVTRDNQLVERTLVGKISPPYSGESFFPDITVGVLDSDVPPTIGFAKILPDDWAAYLSDGPWHIPCLALDQEEKSLVTRLWLLGNEASFEMPETEPQLSFFESIVSGDSGHPAFMIVDGQLVLMTVWTYGSGGLGTFLTGQRAAIDRMMAELGGGYRLTPVDLGRLGRF